MKNCKLNMEEDMEAWMHGDRQHNVPFREMPGVAVKLSKGGGGRVGSTCKNVLTVRTQT